MIAKFPMFAMDALRDEMSFFRAFHGPYTAPPRMITFYHTHKVLGDRLVGQWHVEGAPEEFYDICLEKDGEDE